MISEACSPLFILTIGVVYLVFLFRIPAEMLEGEESNMIDNIWLQASLNGQKLFDLDVFINLKKNMPEYVYTQLEKNPHSTVGVIVWSYHIYGEDIITSNYCLADDIDQSNGPVKYFLQLGRPRSDKATYRVFVKSLWADELWDLQIDTRSFKSLPGRPKVNVKFRSV